MSLVRQCDFCKNPISGNAKEVIDGKYSVSIPYGTGSSIVVSVTVTTDIWDGGEGRNNHRGKPDTCPACLGKILQGQSPTKQTTR